MSGAQSVSGGGREQRQTALKCLQLTGKSVDNDFGDKQGRVTGWQVLHDHIFPINSFSATHVFELTVKSGPEFDFSAKLV